MFVIKSLYAAFFEITGSASRPTGPRAVKPAKTSLPPQAAVRPASWGFCLKPRQRRLFYKKSPLESRKTTVYFCCLASYQSLSRYPL